MNYWNLDHWAYVFVWLALLIITIRVLVSGRDFW